MTKEEFIREVCMHCIHITCDKSYIKKIRGRYGIIEYKCGRHRDLFKCCQKNCNSCRGCGNKNV